MLTSAYMGYGVASLDQDAGEIRMLVDLLRREFDAKVRGVQAPTLSMIFPCAFPFLLLTQMRLRRE